MAQHQNQDWDLPTESSLLTPEVMQVAVLMDIRNLLSNSKPAAEPTAEPAEPKPDPTEKLIEFFTERFAVIENRLSAIEKNTVPPTTVELPPAPPPPVDHSEEFMDFFEARLGAITSRLSAIEQNTTPPPPPPLPEAKVEPAKTAPTRSAPLPPVVDLPPPTPAPSPMRRTKGHKKHH